MIAFRRGARDNGAMSFVRNLLNRRARKSPPQEERQFLAPPGQRIYAIGDIHGRADLLRTLLSHIVAELEIMPPEGDFQLILLGDLVDRGPNSREVVDLAIKLRETMPGFACLMGNHEEVFRLAMDGQPEAVNFFRRIGGHETLLSYGVEEDLILHGSAEDLHQRMLECVPQSHLAFLESLPDSMVVGDYLFVHAGIRPGVPLEDQTPADLRWIREEFLGSAQVHPYMVVHGHSISGEVDLQPNRIGIDTGAFMSEQLTAIGLEGRDRWFLST